MKLLRLYISILFVLLLSISPNFAKETPDVSSVIPTTKVLFLETIPGPSALGARTKAYLSTPFKFPFYQAVAKPTVYPYTTAPTKNVLKALATESGADLVLLPVIEEWLYRTFTPHFGFLLFSDYDPETYVQARAEIHLYSYNAKTDEFRIDSAAYDRVEEQLMAPSEDELLQNMTEKILKKLPYKRVPNEVKNKTMTK